MRSNKLTPYLGIFFIVAVIIPSVILSLIAIRAVNREEVYIEKRLEGTLLAELTHVVSLVNTELKNIEQELNTTIDILESDFDKSFSQWKEKSPLVDFPFLLSSTREILWPVFSEKLTNEEKDFLSWGREVFSDQAAIPVYQNIAVVYKKAIMDEVQYLDSKVEQVAGELKGEGRDSSSLLESTPSASKESASYEEEYITQQAMSQFERSEPVRRKVYEQAKEKGQKVSLRKVALSEKGRGKIQQPHQEQESIFIAETQTFSAISAKGESGIIPRFSNEKLKLIFWKRDAGGRLIGCEINQIRLKERILSVLPPIYSPVRILTLLDENGVPLITPHENKARDWRRPFVAQEISGILPHWEAAMYLSDPAMISSKARVVALTMWMLISVLFVSILTGGTLVLRSFYSELTLAQQKTTFVANVSHELKTPLTSIRMFAEMLKERRQPDEHKREKYFNLMVSETERLTRLINNVLDFSRRGQGKKQYTMRRVDIVHLYQDIVESQRVRLEHNGFEVNFVSGEEQIYVCADDEAIKQAVINLLSNAEKYSRETKKIYIEVLGKEEFVLINIMDRGVGVAPEHAQKIFKEFYRIDDTLTSHVRGTGLGLTIARRIMQDHGGNLVYFPRDGGGSIFQIKLPIEEKK